MTATNPRDADTVRALLRQHVPSGFPVDRAPLTVGDVACRMVSEHARGAEQLTAEYLDTSRALVTSTVMIEEQCLTGRRVQEILRATGVALPNDDRYWIKFQRAASEMLLGRNPGGPVLVIACERDA